MSYLLLVVERADSRKDRPPEDRRRAREQMMRFGEGLKTQGVLKATESLRSVSEGVRIEAHGGKRTVVDGPFAEAKEIVGGFFLLDCTTKEEAIAIASSCPAIEWAAVEVREVGPCDDD